jgi:hypothetical protein
MSTLEFNTEDVVIAADGRVTINNPDFAKKLIEHAKRMAPGEAGFFDNCDCTKKSISEVKLSSVLPATKLRLDPGTLGIFDDCSCKGLGELRVDVANR